MNRLSLFSALSATTFLLTSVSAQPSPPDPLAPSTDDVRALSPAELRARGDSRLDQIRKSQGELKDRMLSAKDEKDVVKTLCIDDKLAQVDVAESAATDRHASLLEALDGNALERAGHEFTLLSVLADRVMELSSGATQCIGEEAAISEETPDSISALVIEPLPETNSEVVELPPVLAALPPIKSPID